jgi:hypothetical protein
MTTTEKFEEMWKIGDVGLNPEAIAILILAESVDDLSENIRMSLWSIENHLEGIEDEIKERHSP